MSESQHALSWDDLRIVKAIGDRGSLVAAAELLDVNHSTVSRRLDALERALGSVLFDRRRGGYVPTGSGAEMIALAARMEKDIVCATLRVSGHAQSHKGDLRITTSDALLQDFLTPVIADFRACNPAVHIEVIVTNKSLNLARGESDIAFRATTAPPENLVGRKIADIAWAIYGRRSEYGGVVSDTEALYRRQWVAYGKGLSGLRAFDFINGRVSTDNIAYRSDSVAGVATAIRAGIGIGFLPCMHGDVARDLIRISPLEPAVADQLWVLTHPEIRRSARVLAFMRQCADTIAQQRDLIEGRAPIAM